MILHELEKQFSDVAYPGDQAVGDSYPNEWEPTLRRLHGKDWRQVTVDDFDSQGGLIEGVQALSLKGFIYFLPGLVRIALTQPDHRYTIASALLPLFTHPDYLGSSFERQQAIMTALSPQRREFLVRFFAAMQEAETTLCPVVVESAIANLRNGRVASYRHADVEKLNAKGG